MLSKLLNAARHRTQRPIGLVELQTLALLRLAGRAGTFRSPARARTVSSQWAEPNTQNAAADVTRKATSDTTRTSAQTTPSTHQSTAEQSASSLPARHVTTAPLSKKTRCQAPARTAFPTSSKRDAKNYSTHAMKTESIFSCLPKEPRVDPCQTRHCLTERACWWRHTPAMRGHRKTNVRPPQTRVVREKVGARRSDQEIGNDSCGSAAGQVQAAATGANGRESAAGRTAARGVAAWSSVERSIPSCRAWRGLKSLPRRTPKRVQVSWSSKAHT